MGRAEDLYKRVLADGEQAIDNFIADRQSEELFIDFKQSADRGKGLKLHNVDRSTIAKAISGFGNSEGGIIVWGVDCRDHPEKGDVATQKVPLENPKRFASWLEGVVSGCTIPPHPGVRHHAIEVEGGEGYVVTYVAKSTDKGARASR